MSHSGFLDEQHGLLSSEHVSGQRHTTEPQQSGERTLSLEDRGATQIATGTDSRSKIGPDLSPFRSREGPIEGHEETASPAANHSNDDGLDEWTEQPSSVVHSANDQEQTECCASGSSNHGEETNPCTHREWIPIMLRPLSSGCLATYSVMLCIAFEVLSLVNSRQHGFPGSNLNLVRATRYVPTISVILLGFVWKGLLTDLKGITPWAAMNCGWTKATDCILLNYLDALEPTALIEAARHHHWALVLALLGDVLSGALVPLANALVYTTPNLHIAYDVDLAVAGFNFNHTLMTTDGSITLPADYTGEKPYAGIASSLQANGQYPPWTTESYVFGPFNLSASSSSALIPNGTLSGTTLAVTGLLDCSVLRNSIVFPDEIFIDPVHTALNVVANSNDVLRANCSVPINQWVQPTTPNIADSNASTGFLFNTTKQNETPCAWLNATACAANQSDIRLLFTLLQPYGVYFANETSDTLKSGSVWRSMSLLCSPQFTSQDAIVEVNASTAQVINYELTAYPPQSIDIGLSALGMAAFLNNPTDPNTVTASLTADSWEPRAATLASVIYGALAYRGLDPFGRQLLTTNDRPFGEYFTNGTTLIEDVSALFASSMVQIIHSLALGNSTAPGRGTVTALESRLFVRQQALRSLQVLLGLLFAACTLCSTLLRPRTCLEEDPGTLGAVALILARSHGAENALSSFGAAKPTMFRDLRAMKVKLVRISAQGPSLQFVEAQSTDSISLTDKETSNAKGFRSLALRMPAKIMLLSVLVAVIIVVSVLLKQGRSEGYLADTSVRSAAWSLVPTTILVLTGAAASSVVSAVRSMMLYIALRANDTCGRITMTWNPRSNSDLTLPFYAVWRIRSLSLMAAAFVTIIYPATKITAAGLFDSAAGSNTTICSVTTDTSLMDHLERLWNMSSVPTAQVQGSASQFAEWTQIPDFGVPQRSGIFRNMVFANVTTVSIDSLNESRASALQMRLPAIEVSVECSTFDNEQFDVVANFFDDSVQFGFACNTYSCGNATGIGVFYDNLTGPFPGTPTAWAGWAYGVGGAGPTRYVGYAYLPQDTFGDILNLSQYQVAIADFTSIGLGAGNMTPISASIYPPFLLGAAAVTPNMFNVTLPTIRAVSCDRSLSLIHANVTLTKDTKVEIDGTTSTLPWSVIAVDVSSASHISTFNATSFPQWLAPYTAVEGDTIQEPYPDEGATGILRGEALRPAGANVQNFFEDIAAYQQFQVGNMSGLLDVEQLATAVEAMYAAYNLQVLTELRPYALEISNASASTSSMPAILLSPQDRVRQDLGTTIAVDVMLFAVLCCLILIFIKFPSRRVVWHEPGSIAAQVSLLQGSFLVKRLTLERPAMIKDTAIWSETFGLGWWSVYDEKAGKRALRWGIDIGKLGPELQEHLNITQDSERTHSSKQNLAVPTNSVENNGGTESASTHLQSSIETVDERPETKGERHPLDEERGDVRDWLLYENYINGRDEQARAVGESAV